MKELQHTQARHDAFEKETKADEQKPYTQIASLPKPQGIGMAVAFDWGLAVQLLVTPFIPLFLENVGLLKSLKLSPALTTTVTFLITLPFAALLAIFGEGVRRGWRWARPIQIGFNALAFLGGFATLPQVWQGSKNGNYWPIVTAVILLVFSPLVAWRLSRPATGRWFATVTSAEARKRHGGSWPLLISLWAIVGGILQAITALSR
ncbi:MAG: hypothetical protein NVS4B7_16920 [Ktedonobacteraceae bacterium]